MCLCPVLGTLTALDVGQPFQDLGQTAPHNQGDTSHLPQSFGVTEVGPFSVVNVKKKGKFK